MRVGPRGGRLRAEPASLRGSVPRACCSQDPAHKLDTIRVTRVQGSEHSGERGRGFNRWYGDDPSSLSRAMAYSRGAAYGARRGERVETATLQDSRLRTWPKLMRKNAILLLPFQASTSRQRRVSVSASVCEWELDTWELQYISMTRLGMKFLFPCSPGTSLSLLCPSTRPLLLQCT